MAGGEVPGHAVLDVAEVSVVKRYFEQLPPSMGPPGKSDRRAVTATCLPRMLLWGCGSSWKAGLDPRRGAVPAVRMLAEPRRTAPLLAAARYMEAAEVDDGPGLVPT